MNGDLRVGLDIGATKILGAVVDADGTVVAQARQDTRPGADGVLASATAVLDSLALRLDGALPSHIGIGVCGIVDRDRGAVRHAVNLGIGGDWFPLAARLADRTGATVLIENDVNAATWGAHVLSGADDLAYLSVGTGLAAGFVLSGSLRRGAHGAAAEIGHLPGDPDGPRCSCGQRGCLELSASGSTLAAAWPARRASTAGRGAVRRGRGGEPRGGHHPRPLRRGAGRRDPDRRPDGRPGRDHHRRRRRERGGAAARRRSPRRCAPRPPGRRSSPRSTWPAG